MHSSDTADESNQSLAGPAAAGQQPPSAKPFRKAERLRGLKEGRVQLELLRQKWPYPFAARPDQVRPLASSATQTIAEAMGWSLPYGRGVINVWKNGSVYCNAILRYDTRVHLDGSPSDERVDDHARDVARARLAQIAARPRPKQHKGPRDKAAAAPPVMMLQATGERPEVQPREESNPGAAQQSIQTGSAFIVGPVEDLGHGGPAAPRTIIVPPKPVEARAAPLSPAEEREKLFRAKMAQIAKRRRR